MTPHTPTTATAAAALEESAMSTAPPHPDTTISAPEHRRGWLRRDRLPGLAQAPAYTPRIALRSIDGHLTRTGDDVHAWYRLSPQRWSFRSDSARTDLIRAIAGQYAELAGRWLHLRVTSRPWPIRDWAAAHADNARDRLPDIPGAESWAQYLRGEQRQLLGRSMAEKEVYLGVQVQTRTLVDRAVDTLRPVLKRVFPSALDAELTAIDAEVEHLNQVLACTGLEGRPVTGGELAWLVHRSCTLGMPAPRQLHPTPVDHWDPEDLAAFTDPTDWTQEPYAPTLAVHGRTGPTTGLTRHIAVLTTGLMHGLDIPETDDPWLQRADRLPGGAEISARLYIRRPDDVAGELGRQQNKVRSQVKHYVGEHELDPPQALARQRQRMLEIDDEMTTGFTALATRVRSWWRYAVSADTEADALRLAQQLVDLYKPKVTLEHPEAQYALAREFIPGEPLACGAYARRGSVLWAASAVPTATADVGDRRGVLLGETSTATRRPVVWDPWMAQEIRDASGLTAIVAGLGAGKSFLGGGLVYKTLRAGAQWTLLDPSGPLARLAELPELRPFSRVINLLNAQPGILNPYRLIPDPTWDDALTETGGDPDEALLVHHRESALAAATRRRLTLDVLTGLLPYDVARMPQSRIVLLRAVREVGGRTDAHPGLVFDALRRDDTEHHDHARAVADFLDEMRERMTLLIPDTGADPYQLARDDRLTVLTMAGLTLPKDGVGREHWTDSEAMGVELLNLAAWLTQRAVYERPRNERKGVWIDEAFFLSEVPTGRVLMNRFARDSRKWNVRVLLSSQIPADFLRMEGFATLLDSVFVGRLDDNTAQTDALHLLKVPTGIGYEQTLASLGRRPGLNRAGTSRDTQPRQFVFADGAGGVERIRIDFSGEHLAGLRAALDTTPGQHTPGQHTPDPAPPATDDHRTPPDTTPPGSPPGAAPPELDELDDDHLAHWSPSITRGEAGA